MSHPKCFHLGENPSYVVRQVGQGWFLDVLDHSPPSHRPRGRSTTCLSVCHTYTGVGVHCCLESGGARMEVVKHQITLPRLRHLSNKREDPAALVLSPGGQEETGETEAGGRTPPLPGAAQTWAGR